MTQYVPKNHKPGEVFYIRLTKDVIFTCGGEVESWFKPGTLIKATAYNERSGYWVANPGEIYNYEAELLPVSHEFTKLSTMLAGLKERLNKLQPILASALRTDALIDSLPTRFKKNSKELVEYLSRDVEQLRTQIADLEQKIGDFHDMVRRSHQEAERGSKELAPQGTGSSGGRTGGDEESRTQEQIES